MSVMSRVLRHGAGLLAAAGFAILSLATTPADAATPAEIKARGKLIVGIITDYPPFGGVDEKQLPAGYDADVSNLLAKALGVQLELVTVTGPNRIPYLLTNKVDVIIATFGITAERQKQVLFSNPYSTLTIYVLAPKNLSIKTPEDLKPVTISVARASTQDTAITAIMPQGTPLKRYDDDATALQALVSGQVQAMGAGTPVLAHLTKNYPQLNIEAKITLREQGNGMAFRKEDAELAEFANKFIAENEANGELSKSFQKWFGVPLPKLPPMPKF